MRNTNIEDQDNDLPAELRGDMRAATDALRQYRETGRKEFVELEVGAWERVLENPAFARADVLLTVGILNDSANAWQRLYEINGDGVNLDKAIANWQKAILYLPMESPLMPAICSNLGNGLNYRYSRTGNLQDLDLAITASEKAVQLAAKDSRDLFKYWNNLGNALRERYLRTAQTVDLDHAIDAYQQAVQRLDEASPIYPKLFSNLGIALTERYIHAGQLDDLHKGIRVFDQAVRATPSRSPALPTMLNNFAIALRERYGRKGKLDDLEQSIATHRRSIELTPETSPDLPARYNNLGNALNEKYARSRDITVLDAATAALRQAVDTSPPDSPNLPGRLNNYAAMLNEHYLRTLDTAHLNRSIDAYRKAIEQIRDRATALAALHSNLGNALRNRYHRLEQEADLHEAIESYRQALSGLTETAPDRPTIMNNLANGLSELYEISGKDADLASAVEMYEQAIRLGQELYPQFGLGSAKNWLKWAFRRRAWSECETVHGYAREIGERLVRVQALRGDKETWLRDTQGITAKAAYALARLDKPEQAALALETGQARLLSEALNRDRADLERLNELGQTKLFEHYRQAVDLLHHWMRESRNNDLGDAREQLRKAHEELESCVVAIRRVAGYERFLQTPGFEIIEQAARETILAYLCSTEHGGVAIIVHTGSVGNAEKSCLIKTAWLDEFTEAAVQALLFGEGEQRGYLHAYQDWRKNPQNTNTRAAWFAALENTGRQLWEWVMGPLFDAFREIRISPGHVTLIPTGRLALLPLHASWTESKDKPTGRRYALDGIRISHAPNAKALVESHKALPVGEASDWQLLAIDEPNAQGAGKLPNARLETDSIAALFPRKRSLFRHADATREAVLQKIPDCSVLHFSCHGYANLQEPLRSGLAMSGKDQWLTVQDFLDLRLSGVRLAVLSACETAVPGSDLPDEVINLPSSLLQAGVSGVVSSLWAVSDLSTMLLMRRFYELWRFDDSDNPAEALCRAQQWVRDSTNADLKGHFEQQMQQPGEIGRVAQEIYEKLDLAEPAQRASEHSSDTLRLKWAPAKRSRLPDGERPFEHPFYWAGFIYVA